MISSSAAIVIGTDSERATQESRENPQLNRSGLITCLEFHGNVQGRMLLEYGLDEALISLAYVLLLSFIGGGMVLESLRALRRARAGESAQPWSRRHGLLQRLPLQMRFPRSGLYVSAIPPVALGVGVGVLAAVMGVGGGFVLVPAMIYLLHMPARTVVGTSLFQILLLSSLVTLLQAIVNGSVDIVLAGLMIVGAVVGAQVGGMIGRRLQSEQIRVLLGALVLTVAAALALDLFIAPSDLFSVTEIGR